MENITKKIFVDAYNKFPPNKFIEFIFKYFSKRTEQKDVWVKNTFLGVVLALFFVGMIATVLKLKGIFILIPTLIYAGLLASLVISSSIAAFLNNLRIKKIRKELGGISRAKYDELVKKYLN